MTLTVKIAIGILGFVSISTFSACNGISAKSSKPENTKAKLLIKKVGVKFVCPMHGEVTGNEGDLCPKCGMRLEREVSKLKAGSVKMRCETFPSAVRPNEQVILSFRPELKEDVNQEVPLDIEHERKIHLIVVNKDLSNFEHIHPEINADGSYIVKHKFPSSGQYILFADYKPKGFSHTVDTANVVVIGNEANNKTYSIENLTSKVDNYEVCLKPIEPTGGKFIAKTPMHLVATVTRNGKVVDPNTMQNYLGAKAHMVVIGLRDKEYMHVHPNVLHKQFDLHTTFNNSGIYRAWIQFQISGSIHTCDFVIKVEDEKANF